MSTRTIAIAAAWTILSTAAALAHPGIGIVQDRHGNVFYTDLKQIWKITPDGKKSVVVPNVHSHELSIDADGNLYGEHLWYEGDKTGKWGHRVWRLSADGKLADIIPAHEGFQSDYSFVRDAAGNLYWADRDQSQILKRTPDDKIAVHAKAEFHDIRWMTATPDGTLYLIDAGNLRRITPAGEVSTVVAKLSSKNPPPRAVTDKHYHMGLWTDAEGSVYVAVSEERLALKIGPKGDTAVIARTSWPWAPSGGLFDPQGNLWLLEYSVTNDVRVRRIDRNGKATKF